MRLVNMFIMIVRVSMGYVLASKCTTSLNFLTTKFFSLFYLPQPILLNQVVVNHPNPVVEIDSKPSVEGVE